jgi:pimeloyl-ACP methyl ester carboxylesterase
MLVSLSIKEKNMYRYQMQSDSFVEDSTQGIKEILMDSGFDGLGMYYVPINPNEKSNVGVVIMHCEQNYMAFPMGPALASQGYRVVVCEAREGGILEDKFIPINRAIRFLKSQGADKVVLMGHSGGATLMTAYQAVAENGVEVFQGAEKIWKCQLKAKVEPADGIMLIDPNYGNAVMLLISLDPSIEEEGNGTRLNNKWDILSSANGYTEEKANYSKQFQSEYRQAQARRNNKLINIALERLSLIQSNHGKYVDDEPFVIAGGSQIKPNNRMIPQDVRLLSVSKQEHDLLHGDGSITHELIHSVRTKEVDKCFSSFYGMGANRNTIKGFLSSQAIRTQGVDFNVTESEVVGVDWDSSYASPIGNVKHIKVPMLTMGMTGSYEYLAAEMIYDNASMDDKEICFVHGAGHNLKPNHLAERQVDEFGDTEGAVYNHMGKWLERFIK